MLPEPDAITALLARQGRKGWYGFGYRFIPPDFRAG